MKLISILSLSCYLLLLFSSCEKKNSLEILIKQKAFDNNLDEKDMEDLLAKTGLLCDDLMDSIALIYQKTNKILPVIYTCKDNYEKGSFAKDYSLNMSVNFYIENSASMLGYFDNNSDFRSVILALSAFFKEKKSSVLYYYINENIYQIDNNKMSFINALSLENAKKYGNLNYSALDEMLQKIIKLQSTKNKTLSIFVSDFIYDVQNIEPEKEQLNIQYKIRDIFAAALQEEDKAVLILRMQSEFSGLYFDYKDQKTALQNAKRPYYICMLGERKFIQFLNENFDWEMLLGYDKRFLFVENNTLKNTYISILPTSSKEGKLKREVSKKNTVAVTEIKQVVVDEKTKRLALKIALDLNNMPFDKDYLLNIKNYRIESHLQNSLSKIETIEQASMNKNDYRFLSTATHILTLYIEQRVQKIDTLQIHLLYNHPDWNAYSSTDDSQIKTQLNKTFGLSAIMQGLQAASNSNMAKYYALWQLIIKP